MKNYISIVLITLLSLAYTNLAIAEQQHTNSGANSTPTIKSTAAGCLPGGGFKYMDLNNVRFRVNTGGDMWWNFEVAQYEIPKGSKKMSMFSASLWIGGIDVNDQLKLAALRYRQSDGGTVGAGNDYWPGPLTTDGTAAISESTCAEYDKLFPMTRNEVDEFLASRDNPDAFPDYKIPESFINWPAHGKPELGQSYYLAPFFDEDSDGDYDPEQGDYPYYDISNKLCHTNLPTAEGNGILVDQVLKGDATLWWVFNDKGNIHTETQGSPIGLEIRGQAFAFATNDEINNMTFYSYEIINRSTYRLRETYFSQWVDTDLGFAEDDYVGCDVKRGLGYCYNGKQKDGNGQSWAYGDQPPAIGVDFFQGPYMDPDGLDNPKFNPKTGANCDVSINGVNFANDIIDDERFGMRRFLFHTNSNGNYDSDPDFAPDYYNLLKGIWVDGQRMIYGGKAHPSANGYGPACDFMFPGDSDPCNWGTGGQPPNGDVYWTEVTAGNPPEDRRFMQSAGPFTLEPGAVNYITVGIPWARAASGGPLASVDLLRVVDDKCQDLFDNCFKVIQGPNAPDLTIKELNQELLIYISNRKTPDAGNNYNEGYHEIDPAIKSPDELGSDERYDSTYNFEGYKVYQVLNSQVSIAEIQDDSKARLVFQCDIKNDVTKLVNYNFDQAIGASVPVEEVNGSNTGIVHSFQLQNDIFTGERFVNHKQYYFLAIAYGFNEFMKYSDDAGSQVPGVSGLLGQKRPYLAGRKNIKVYTGIPHIPIGTTGISSVYGEGPVITRIQGQGNGGNLIDLSDESIAEILSKQPADSALNPLGSANYPICYKPTYKKGRGPLNIRVIDPLNVKDANYTLRFDSLYYKTLNVQADTASIQTGLWSLVDNSTGKVYHSDTTITINNEQLFPELGLSVSVQQIFHTGPYKVGETAEATPNPVYGILLDNNGLIESSIEYADSSRQWFSGVPDIDGGFMFDWIRSGTVNDASDVAGINSDWNMRSNKPFDPDGNFEKIAGGTLAPYYMTAYTTQTESGPAMNNTTGNTSKVLSRPIDLASVDIVMTPDKSKWTRCPVVEMCPDTSLSEGHVEKFAIRASQSVDKEGNFAQVGSGASTNPDDPNYIAETGMGWFPGYAINIETGERLNIMFGENSWLSGENGRDMKFNPTSKLLDNGGNIIFGGQHYYYVMAHTEGKKDNIPDLRFDCPAYDAGANLRANIARSSDILLRFRMDYQYSNAMYVGIPLANPGLQWLSSEMKIRIRMQKPYHRYYSTDLNNSTSGIVDTENRNFPMYNFATKGIATVTNSIEKAKSDLDLINVVPNPYYAYANYEVNQLDNRVKITNLPQKCTVTIYSLNGTIIRQYNKDEAKTTIDWDLKNSAGIPISGGVYIIHIKSEGIGEKVIKFFGALRPVDLNSF